MKPTDNLEMEVPVAKFLIIWFILSSTAKPTVNESLEQRRHFRVALFEEAIAQKFIKGPDGSVIGYSGFSSESLDWISKRLKFTYTIVPLDDYKMDLLPNGTWTGSIVPLLRKEVDYMFNSILLSHEIGQYVEYSATDNEEPVVLYTQPPYEESRLLAPIKPFSWTVWLMLIAFMGFVSMGTYYIFIVEKKLRPKVSSKKIQKPDNVLEGTWRVLMGQDIGTGIVLLAKQNDVENAGGFPETYYTSHPKRLCVAAWCLAAIIFVNAYSSSFISYASAPKLIYPAKSLEDVAYRSNLQLVLVGTNRLQSFYNTTSPLYKKLGEQLSEHPENILSRHRYLTEKIATGCCVGLLFDWLLKSLLFLDYQKYGQCRATVAKEPQYWEHYAFAGQKGDPFMKNISQEVLWMRAHGFVYRLLYSELKLADKCLTHPPPKVRPLKLTDLISVFLILCFGFLLSAAIFVGELYMGKNRTKSKGQTKLRGWAVLS